MTHAATNFFRGRNFTMANKLLLSVTAVALASAALASSPAAAQNRQQKAQAAGDYRSEEHTSELQSLMRISYAVFCLNKKNNESEITSEDCDERSPARSTQKRHL